MVGTAWRFFNESTQKVRKNRRTQKILLKLRQDMIDELNDGLCQLKVKIYFHLFTPAVHTSYVVTCLKALERPITSDLD